MSQVVAMAKQIEDLERTLHAVGDNYVEARTPQTQDERNQPTTILPVTLSGLHEEDPPEEQHSAPTFHSTSAVQEPERDRMDLNVASTASAPILSHGLEDFSMTNDQVALWQSRAAEVCAMQLHLPFSQINHLFETYWTWVYPAFMFVSKPHFLMSTAVGDRYSSPLLSSVVCLQATRFTDHLLREELLSHVRLLLGQEIHRQPTMPLLQALLQLSAREIGNGSLHQAWLYSGMAFRLAVDMGIMAEPARPGADTTDNAMRGQMAWSCYLWDKSISLYLGRAPSLSECPNFEPALLDQGIETAMWMPYPRESNASNIWPPTQSYGVSCFINFCKIGKIIHDVLDNIYAKKAGCDGLAFVQHTRERLESWRLNSPQHLKVPPGSQSCHPTHILSQKYVQHISYAMGPH